MSRTDPRQQPGIAARIRAGAREERRFGYWPVVGILLLTGLAALLLTPRRFTSRPLVLPRPNSARPTFEILDCEDISTAGVGRMNVSVLVQADLPRDSLKDVLAWSLYVVLDSFNRRLGHDLRIVWVYALESATDRRSNWRAMAVWIDPMFPATQMPPAARLDGNALRVGPVAYEFTNPARKDR